MSRKGIEESNFVSESGHDAETYDLQVCGTIDLQHCTALIQSESNTNFGRENELLVHGRKAFKEKIMRGMGGFHLLPPELQRTAVLTAKWNRKSHMYDFKIAMVEQLEMKHRKEEIILEKNLEMHWDIISMLCIYSINLNLNGVGGKRWLNLKIIWDWGANQRGWQLWRYVSWGIINCLFILIFVNIMNFYLFRNKHSWDI